MERTRALPGMFLVVEVKLTTIGDQSPYFSVTGAAWDNRSQHLRKPDDPHTVGQMHDDILRAFPDLADVVALHLSDITGVPMHAVANGWYWYQEDRATCAEYLRVPLVDLPEGLNADTFAEFANAQRDRWAAEARAAIEKYEL